MAIGKDIVELQALIDYKFTDISLLEIALTHTSYANEQRGLGNVYSSNERLEFLGDAVLQIVISEFLYESNKNFPEGALTKIRQRLVCEKSLAKIGRQISIGKFINLGKDGENSDCRNSQKVIADMTEALFGAVYLDSKNKSGLDYKRVIISLFNDEMKNLEGMQKCDYKTMLKQLVEKDGASILEYRVVSETGPEHEKEFSVVACVNNNIVGNGKAGSKKEAEMNAAMEALRLFGVEA